MTKDQILNIRIDEFDQVLLDKLCKESVRTKSDMVRYLIRKEYDQRQTTDKAYQPYDPGRGAIVRDCSDAAE